MQSCHPRSSRPSLMTGMLRRELLLSFSRESSSTCQHTSSFHDEEQHRNPTKMEEPCARTSGCSRTNRGAPQSSAAASNQCQDLWIDKQGDVNHLTFQLRHQRHSGRDNQQEDQPDACGGGSSSSWLSPYNIKILQTSLHEPLFLLGLLEALEGRSSTVHRISLFGVALDTTVSSRLVKVLQHPDCAIQGLQICRLAPESVPILASTLAESATRSSLTDLQLTFQHDLTTAQRTVLLEALQSNHRLTSVKLNGANLGGDANDAAVANQLATWIRTNRNLRTVGLTNCHLRTVQALVDALRETNVVERLDLSMNQVQVREWSGYLPTVSLLACAQRKCAYYHSHRPPSYRSTMCPHWLFCSKPPVCST